MAIIIEHMEMPNGCCECRMQTENCCTLSLRRIDDIYDRPEWCLLTDIGQACHDCKNYEEAKNGCNGFCKEWNAPTYSWEWCSRGAKEVENG